ncbi:MAG: hypothetical protein A3K19_05720 [Lentisphaerae bacterium RIFOXYB12_FULL_65_16]|nr:MAG: hypothetical protein A3K18_23760 [Lentisphaerae bacterium RIFOXYA12_64_32]OGV94408.1 MAG: hypothetical protein A3K19_05720 [Lentisphaerae bacterium RIFOXYB12_FULL_65_16]
MHSGKAAGRWQFPEVFPQTKCMCFPADWSRCDRIAFWLHSPAADSGKVTVNANSFYPNTAGADKLPKAQRRGWLRSL